MGPDRRWYIGWDTDFLPNGSYEIKLAYQYGVSSQVTVWGASKSVVINNSIAFDRLTSQFTDSGVYIMARLASSNTTYTIQLYDEYGNPLVGTQRSTTNGRIALYWDLTDGNGNQISFGNIRGVIRLNVGGTSLNSATPIQHWWLKEPNNTSGNGFVVAWGWHQHYAQFTRHRNDMMMNGVLNILGNPSDFDSYFMEPYPFNVPYSGNSFRFDSERDKRVLLGALQRNSRFFWLGHGGWNTLAGDEVGISAQDVQNALGNLLAQATPKHPKTNSHLYKLAILNGCQTYSSAWSQTFGVDYSATNSTDTALAYQYTGRSPRAFVGWTNLTEVPSILDYNGGLHAQFGVALAELFSNWMAGAPLDFCLDMFADTATSYGFSGHDSWCISGCCDLRRYD
jgi:hypothetical protein